ncbi:hypothetical protein HY357_04095 [Candidatus Roizmanbacteria bacterium]|nr:hypothetical protein [Candidatus Roizmanbacteria bacterium]
MKHQTLFKNFLIILFYLLSSIFYIPSSLAQESSLSLSPSLSEIIIKPGQSIKQRFRLTNKSDPLIVILRVLPFETGDTQGHIIFKDQSKLPLRFDIENADTPLDQAFLLKTSETKDIDLRIQTNEGTSEKDYYLSLVAQTQPPPPQEGISSLRAKITLASPLLITVTSDGELEVEPKIGLLKVLPDYKFNAFGRSSNLLESGNRLKVVLIVENKGKNFIKPRGNITLKGPFGLSKRYEIKPQNVLAESQRNITLSLEPSGFYLGKHTLSASINFGEATPNLFASTSFFVLPIKIFTLTLFIISLLILIKKRLENS